MTFSDFLRNSESPTGNTNMKIRMTALLALAAAGLQHGGSATETRFLLHPDQPTTNFLPRFQIKARPNLSQRQKRKNRRRAYAAGDCFAFA